jgi:hypothetical protein
MRPYMHYMLLHKMLQQLLCSSLRMSHQSYAKTVLDSVMVFMGIGGPREKIVGPSINLGKPVRLNFPKLRNCPSENIYNEFCSNSASFSLQRITMRA